MEDKLTLEEKQTLLKLARQSLDAGVRGAALPNLDPAAMTPTLRAEGAAFVTLTVDGELRGCIGALQPYQSLAEDVREHAVAAALEDPRFPQVQVNELPNIEIEVSRLTVPVPLDYNDAEDLLAKLFPRNERQLAQVPEQHRSHDLPGLLPVSRRQTQERGRRATFLPQVWEKIPDTAEFLANLCYKMGAAPDTWKRKHLEVLVYQVEEFHE